MRSRLAALLAAFALIAGLLGLTAGPASATYNGLDYFEGTVADEIGVGIPGVNVTLTDTDGNDTGLSTVTSGAGTWKITSVPLGIYLIRYGAPVDGFSYQAPDVASAQPYELTETDPVYVYESVQGYRVPVNWSIKVTRPDGSTVSDLCPDWRPVDDPDNGPYSPCTTDEQGVTTGTVPPGSYLVRFRPDAPDLAWTWLGTDGTEAGATPVTIGPDGVTDLGKVVLRAAGTVSLSVRSPDRGVTFGEYDVCVTAFVQRTQEYGGAGCTDASGVVQITGLAAGTYSLQAFPNSLDYVERWLGNVRDQSASRLVTVTAGQTTTAASITLARSGQIAGKITDRRTGKPLAGFCAVVGNYSFLGGEDGTRTLTSTSCSGADGTYLIRGLDSASYQITVVPDLFAGTGSQGYAVGYFGGSTFSASRKVTVNNGRTTGRIDIALGPEAIVTGSVVDPQGNPATDVSVFATDAVSGRNVGENDSFNGGTFTITGLPPTSVLLEFQRYTVTPVWWNGTPQGTTDKSKAVAVPVTPGGTVTLPVTVVIADPH